MKLKDYREGLRIEASQAAKELGVSVSTYWRWEAGLSAPRRIKQLKILDWSGGKVTPNDFLLDSSEERTT